jgi:hypothetical protein
LRRILALSGRVVDEAFTHRTSVLHRHQHRRTYLSMLPASTVTGRPVM